MKIDQEITSITTTNRKMRIDKYDKSSFILSIRCSHPNTHIMFIQHALINRKRGLSFSYI